jgi:hypothetical protein
VTSPSPEPEEPRSDDSGLPAGFIDQLTDRLTDFGLDPDEAASAAANFAVMEEHPVSD